MDNNLDKLKNDLNLINQQLDKIKKINIKEVSPSGRFEPSIFNKKVDEITKLEKQKRKIKNKIKLLKLNYELSNNKIQINYFDDIYNMINELKNIKSFNDISNILTKNYRILTILIIILLILVISFVIINIITN